MDEEEIEVTGYWCTECEVFEDEAPPDRGSCPACGCGSYDHIHVKLIEID